MDPVDNNLRNKQMMLQTQTVLSNLLLTCSISQNLQHRSAHVCYHKRELTVLTETAIEAGNALTGVGRTLDETRRSILAGVLLTGICTFSRKNTAVLYDYNM